MPAPDQRHDRRGASVVAALTARRAARSGVVWGTLLGALVANEALSYDNGFPTLESRRQFAASFGGNSGLTAVTGPARQLGTLEGFLAWRMMSLLIVVGAVWGLLTATRLLRAEEDAGRWELLLAGRTAPRHATVQALVGLLAGWAAFWVPLAVATTVAGSRPEVGISVPAALFYATAGSASAAMFLAVGALTSQLAPSRRQATMLGLAVLGVCYLLRLVADGGILPAWVRWTGPLGWVENLAPLTDPQPWALVPIVALVAGCAAGAVVLAGRRDVGTGVLARAGAGPGDVRMLDGPVGLAVRLERGTAIGWVVGLSLMAVVFGLVARAAGGAGLGDSAVTQLVSGQGGHGSVAAAWLGYELLYLATALAFAAAAQLGAMRREEAEGRLDNLLVRPLTRSRWLAGRLGVSAGLVLVGGLAVGLGGWAGLAGQGHVSLGSMLVTGLDVAVPGLVVLGVGALALGTVPRVAAPVMQALVLYAFFVVIFGSAVSDSEAFRDTSVLSLLGPVPATDVRWTTVVALLAVSLGCAVLGALAFRRRDLAEA